jgi:hypothetical protein
MPDDERSLNLINTKNQQHNRNVPSAATPVYTQVRRLRRSDGSPIERIHNQRRRPIQTLRHPSQTSVQE